MEVGTIGKLLQIIQVGDRGVQVLNGGMNIHGKKWMDSKYVSEAVVPGC